MKNYIKIVLFASFVLLASSCSDWLDVDPIDQNLEPDQYASEQGINNVLNGLYVGLINTDNLYGGKLSSTDIEHMAHYYYAPATTSSISDRFANIIALQKFDYAENSVKTRFAAIWKDSYALILRVNVFIKNVESSSVISEEKKNVLLGEAYALRAYLHFDLFRLYGPAYSSDLLTETIPYNTNSSLAASVYITSQEFKDKLIADIEKAKTLLKNDPILTYGIVNPADQSTWTATEKFERCLRNRRFNLIAVKAFEARMLMYMGEPEKAALKAKELLDDQAVAALFKWADSRKVVTDRNYIFLSEVFFGVENPKMYSRWDNMTNGSELYNIYSVEQTNLKKNIFGIEASSDISTITDVRAQQWKVSEIDEKQYVSVKYKNFGLESTNLIKYYQPLIRMTELYYILVEDCISRNDEIGAKALMTSVLKNRGYTEEQVNVALPSMAAIETVLEQEYYREFYGEGQAFFFSKRRQSLSLFKSDATLNQRVDMEPELYVVPLPEDEINK